MRFDTDQERWIVKLGNHIYCLRCGEGLELYIGDIPIPGRLEIDQEWYVILKGVRFNLRPSDKYMVSI